MNDYAIALFLHIVGALGFFVALGLEWMTVRHLRRAVTITQIQDGLRSTNGARRMGMLSMMTLLVSGFYMTVRVWGGIPWVMVSLAALVLLSVIAVAGSGRRMAAIGRAASAESGAVSPALRQLVDHPLLWIAIHTRVAIALGIVFLMTVKPPLAESLIVIGIATVLGLVLSLPTAGRERTRKTSVA